MRRARGFTLVELLIGLALSGLVLAGALQLHAVFNTQALRQREVGDAQQTLRLAMGIVERTVRQASAGMSGGKALQIGCSPAVPVYGFQFFNKNTFPEGPGTVDSTGGDADTDPDWFRVVGATPDQNLATDDNGTFTTVQGPLGNWQAGDLFLVVGVAPNASVLRQVDATGGNHFVHSSSSGAHPCANPAVEACPGGAPKQPYLGCINFPAPVRHFVNEIVMRVLPAVGTDVPRLVMRVAPIGSTTLTGTNNWQVVTENIEDMQIALLMKDGRVATDQDDPALFDPSLAAAVRVTLVARSPSKVPGLATSQTGGYEDEPAVYSNDSYLRRALTSEIELRN